MIKIIYAVDYVIFDIMKIKKNLIKIAAKKLGFLNISHNLQLFNIQIPDVQINF